MTLTLQFDSPADLRAKLRSVLDGDPLEYRAESDDFVLHFAPPPPPQPRPRPRPPAFEPAFILHRVVRIEILGPA